jgi:RNA polymerase sigma factor (TIGR02999 family)
MNPRPVQDVTDLLVASSDGNAEAMAKLVPMVYDELHRLASHYLRRERPDHTLQTTELIHEAYFRLIDQKRVQWQNRSHFFALAAESMRRILLDYARARKAAKRGGGQRKLSLDDVAVMAEDRAEEIMALDEALEELAALDPRQSRIVELRFFGGLTVEETARELNISVATVKREWAVAKAWLYRRLKGS